MKWIVGIAVAACVAVGGFIGGKSLLAADRYAQALAECATNAERASASIRAIRAVYGDPPRSLRLEVSLCELNGATGKALRLQEQVKAAGG